jgi:DNA invertase Pin-like site-specific DNA recombinase
MTKKLDPARPVLRCAIYTRKSTEEGLDQAFNSLHAQREACEAYIKSQTQEGWTALPTLYDDGGFSGGNLERPALRRLLADIDAGRVDTVVVYKIDRLTRALADFAKIVERLDGAGASFVSVTQAFNTTTSMGRLTLNVLLSFAQFEREVTGERIRDKIAASKAKGMWMGGALPLGYDLPTDRATRALVVNPVEAEQVRLIFQRYVELGSVSKLERWLDDNAIRSKAHPSKSGRARGGFRFGRGALFHLLSNRTYIGQIPHKGQSYRGAHPGIVDPELFDAVQALIAANTTTHRKRTTRVSTMPLKGLIFDVDGHPMCPTFGHGRKGQIYRYYVSAPLQQGHRRQPGDDAIRRVPAEAVETLVSDRLQRLGRPRAAATGTSAPSLLRRVEVHATSVHLLILGNALFGVHCDLEVDLDQFSKRLAPGERALVDQQDPVLVRLILPVRLKLRGGRTWIVTPDGSSALAKAHADRTLINALRNGHGLRSAMDVDGAAAIAPASAYDRLLCRIAFLAPDIQRAILEGRQPPGFNLERLIHGETPLAWSDQRAEYGF